AFVQRILRLVVFLVVEVELDLATAILDHHEGTAHADDAAGEADGALLRFQRFAIRFGETRVQVSSHRVTPEVVRKCRPLLTQGLQFLATLRDQLVLVRRGCALLPVFSTHGSASTSVILVPDPRLTAPS